jgi:hypothetical protein
MKGRDRIAKPDRLQKHALAASIQTRLHRVLLSLLGLSSRGTPIRNSNSLEEGPRIAASDEGMHRSLTCLG